MDFQTYHERKNTYSFKWDQTKEVFQSEDVLPMWVADMDFPAPKEVNQVLIERAKHGIYGYTVIDDAVKEAIYQWIAKRYDWKIDNEWLSFSQGIMPALQTAIQALTEVHDKILIQTPVYTPFYDVIENQQREIVKNHLYYKDGKYKIDFIQLEKQLQTGVKAFVLCSPHNPVGRVWTKEELRKIAELCRKHDVLILSDEVHSDLIYPDHKHIPIASLSEDTANRTVTFMAPSKTFNLAGLQAAYSITKEPNLHERIKQQTEIQGMTFLNTMGIIALEAAYTYGEPWLNSLMDTLTEHKHYVMEMFAKHAPEIKVIPPEGTYLLWLDCNDLELDSQDLHRFMIEEARVGLNAGIDYGENGKQFMRMNIACPHKTLAEGVQRIIHAVNNHR